MSLKFRKSSAKRQQPVRKKKPHHNPKLPPKGDNTKTPVTRVGDRKDHRDTLLTKFLYVLIDQPKAPQDSVALEHGSQRLPIMLTADAQDLHDTILVFILLFEHVTDGGKFTLKLTRGESSVELFTDVSSDILFSDNPDVLYGPQPAPSDDDRSNMRLLDYRVIPPHPIPSDLDLGWPEVPLASVSEMGS